MNISAWSFGMIFIRGMIILLGALLFLAEAGAREFLRLETAEEFVLMGFNHWISLVAPVFFLTALWFASGILTTAGRGEAFGVKIVTELNKTGACLMMGAFSAILLQPGLIHLNGNGFTEMAGVRLNFDLENLILVLIGFVLVSLAKKGQAVQSELDSFV